MRSCALITGINGGIGSALFQAFHSAGYEVIGLDTTEQKYSNIKAHIKVDLTNFVRNEDYRSTIICSVKEQFPPEGLSVLVNNAALQILGPIKSILSDEWQKVIDVNVTAPFLLVQGFLEELTGAKGCVVNISSIHAHLTKPGFVAYATSKAALTGLTKALAVDIGSKVRVVGIEPAAISTPMLEAGFINTPDQYELLKSFHPTGEIGNPQDIADAALYLASSGASFLNGTIIPIDGGIASRLHDPV